MELDIYIKAFGIGIGIWLLSAFPIVIATIIALIPGSEIKRKFIFSLVSGVASYGLAVLTYIAFVPFHLLAIFFAPQWEVDGHTTLSHSIRFLSEAGDVVALVVLLLCSVVIPILGRKKYWKIIDDALANN